MFCIYPASLQHRASVESEHLQHTTGIESKNLKHVENRRYKTTTYARSTMAKKSGTHYEEKSKEEGVQDLGLPWAQYLMLRYDSMV